MRRAGFVIAFVGISRRSMRGDTGKRARIGVCRLPQESGQPFRKVGGCSPLPLATSSTSP